MWWSAATRRWSAASLAWRLNSVIVVLAILVVVALRVWMQPATAGDGEGCAETTEAIVRDVEEPAVLIPRPTSLITFRWVFDADDTVKKFPAILEWQNPSQRPASVQIKDQLAVKVGDLKNEESDESVPPDQVRATAVVTGNGVALSVCVDTSGISPDRYTSVAEFVDKDVRAAPFAIDITVKHREEWIPLSAIVAGLALSLIVLVLSVSDDEHVQPARIAALAVAALLVATATARPWEAWQENPTWGKSRFDALTLIAATALAFTGAMVASTTIQDLRKAARTTNGPEPADRPGDLAQSPPTGEPQ